MFSGVYACPATKRLLVERTTCGGEPIGGVCQGADLVRTAVGIPWADDGGSGFSGWRMHAHPGVIDDPLNLGPAELAFLQDRCERACEDQWDDDPSVAQNCGAPGSLGVPYLVSTPSIGARQAIPTAQQDGSGLFGGQALACSLHEDCCQAFDEAALCPAAPDRVTPARDPLGDGQEWEVTLTGAISADSSFAVAPASAPTSGTIGYSLCTEGDGADCPFYLGSMHLELTNPLLLALDCGGGVETHAVTELDLDLVQPALGIAELGTSAKAFPSGALVVEASGIADGLPISERGPLQTAVQLQATPGSITLDETGGASLSLELPCNGQLATVDLSWSFSDDQVTGHPPTVALDLPETVACPGELDLLLTTGTDPDGDLVSIEWFVDGVLLEGAFPTIDVTQNHDITAVLRDARGAASSATKTVKCS